MPQRLGLPFAVLCSVPFVMVLSNSMLIPVLPLMREAMNRSLFQIGLIITAFSVPAGLAIPVGGYLSDRLGRKPVMIPGLLLFGLGGLLAGVAPWFARDPYGWILAGRVVQGLAAGGLYQVALAAAGDMFRGGARTRAMGVLEASNGLGKIASPILGSALALITWYAPFFAYPVLSALAALGLWLLVREPRRRQAAPELGVYLRRMGRIFRAKGVSLAVSFVVGFTALFMLFGLLSVYSDLLERPFGIGGFVKGLVVAIPVAVATVTAYVSGIVLQERLARYLKAVVVAGLAVLAAGTASLYLARGLAALVAGVSVMGLGYGLALPALNTMITSAVESAERGGITALYGTVRFFGAALGPPAFGLLLGAGRGALYLGSGAAVAAVLALVAALLRQDVLLRPLEPPPAPPVPEQQEVPAASAAKGGASPATVTAGGAAPRTMAGDGVAPVAAREAAPRPRAAEGAGPLGRRAPAAAGPASREEPGREAPAPAGGHRPAREALPAAAPAGENGLIIPLGPWSRARSSFPGSRRRVSPAS